MKQENSARRNFIKAAAALLVSAVAFRPTPALAAKKIRWKLATTWPPKMPILQESVEMFSQLVAEATGGNLQIKVYAGGELIPPFGIFDSVSQGTIEAGVGASYYWAGKVPAAQIFTSVPFGMNTQQLSSWCIAGGGLKLWEELYAPHNLKPFVIGQSGTQMGGWYKKEIKSAADLKGLRIRLPGIGGKVLAKVGANVVLMSGSELYTALDRGTIDATEWISPFHDERLGLHRAAKFYYYPSWPEPSANLELMINTSAWNELPKEFQSIVTMAAATVSQWFLAESDAKNSEALARLLATGIELKRFPEDALQALRQATDEVLEELANADSATRKIYDSYRAFQKQIAPWYEIGEEAYYSLP